METTYAITVTLGIHALMLFYRHYLHLIAI